MNTNKTNKGGAKEVTTTQNNKAVSNTTNNAAKPTTTPKSEEKKTAPKTLPTTPKVVEMPPKPKTIEEEIEHFEGKEKLIKNRRVLAKHLEKINGLEIKDDDLLEMENENHDWIAIKLTDRAGRAYEIEVPALVRELHLDLIKRVETKMALYDQKILAYPQS